MIRCCFFCNGYFINFCRKLHIFSKQNNKILKPKKYKNNTAGDRGGIALVSDASKIFLLNSTFDKMKSSIGSLIYSAENLGLFSIITNCIFRNNYGSLNIIDSANTQYQITNCEFYGNVNNLFNVDASYLSLVNLTIKNQKCFSSQQGCVFKAIGNTKLYLSNLNIEDVDSMTTGNIYIENSFLFFENSSLAKTYNKYFEGGCIYAVGGTVSIAQANFSQFSINCILFENKGNLTIFNSIFDNQLNALIFSSKKNQKGMILLDSVSYVNINKSKMCNSKGAIDGAALMIVMNKLFFTNQVLIISNNEFISNNAENLGGAIYLFNANVSIFNNKFLKNKATEGGGIYCNNDGIYFYFLGVIIMFFSFKKYKCSNI